MPEAEHRWKRAAGGQSSLSDLKDTQLPTFFRYLSYLLRPQPVPWERGKNSKATQYDKCKVMP